MFERSIGIRLTLLPAFAEATKLIMSDIKDINKGLQSINEQGSKINISGLQELNKELGTLVGSANAAKTAIESLNGVKITKNVLAALEIGMTGVAASAKVTKEKIQEVGVQAAQTATVIEAATKESANAFFNLGEEIMFAEKALQKLGLFALPQMNSSIVGMKNLSSEISLVESAMRKLDTFVPQNLENSILRLNSGLRSMIALSGGQIPMMLGSGKNNFALGGVPQEQLSAAEQRMLTSGNWAGNEISPYRAALPGTQAQEPGHQFYEGPGAITPYVKDLGRGSWMPRGEQMPGQYGPIPPPNYGASALGKLGTSMMRHGDIAQSAGWGAATPAMMTASIAEPMIKSQTDLNDLYGVAAEALNTVGMKTKNYSQIMSGAEEASTKFGGSLRENISGIYTFASSVPAVSKIDWNDPKQASVLKSAYEKMSEGVVVGGRSTHPVSQEHGILDILSAVTNLGMPAANAEQLSNSIKRTTDMFVQYKNSTSTDFDLLGSTLRNVGAVAKSIGIPAEDIMALVGVLAQGKYRGSISGTSLKRLFSNEVMEPKQARSMINLVKGFGGDISMFDQSGKPQSALDMIGNIVKFEDQRHLPAQRIAQLESSISGRYAWPQVAEMIALTRAMGGSEGLQKYKREQMAGATAGTGATDAAMQARNMGDQNIKLEGQRVENEGLLELHKTFQLMVPDMINFLHGIEGLIKAWHGLSDPIKETSVRIVAWGTALTGVIGIGLIFGGNIEKLMGYASKLGSSLLGAAEHMGGFKAVSGESASSVTNLGTKIAGLTEGLFPRMIAGLSGIVVAMGPIGWTIAAVVTASSILALAWSKDWGGIREKVAGFPEFLGGIVGNIQVWLGHIPEYVSNMAKAFVDGWNSMWANVKQGATDAMNGIGNFIHNFKFQMPSIQAPKIDWKNFHPLDGMPGMDLSKQFWAAMHPAEESFNKGKNDAIIRGAGGNTTPGVFGVVPELNLNAVNKIGPTITSLNNLVGPLSDIPNVSSKPIGPTLAKAAKIHHDVIQTFGPTSVIDDIPSSTSIGGGSSGGGYVAPHAVAAHTAASKATPAVNAGASDQEVADAIAALFGAPKKAKAKKIAADAFLVLKSESISQVEEAAAKITHALEKAGAVIHKKWIDILDPKNFKVTRVFGDPAAFAQALGVKNIDQSLNIAHDYLAKIKREIEKSVPVDMSKVIANLTALAAHAMTEHASNEIVQMADTLTNAFHLAAKKIKTAFDSTKTSFESELLTVSGAGNRFDLIQQNAKVPAAGDTTKSMTAAIKAETSERNALASELLHEEESALRLAVAYHKLSAEYNTLRHTAGATKDQLNDAKTSLDAAGTSYADVTTRIYSQRSGVDDLTASILQQTNAIKLAKDTWSGMFYNIQEKNAALLIDQNFKSIANHVQNYFQLQNTPNGSAGNSAVRQQANDFANQFIQQMISGISGSSGSMADSFLKKIGGKSSKAEISAGETQYIQEVKSSNTKLDKIAANTTYLNPGATGGSVGGGINNGSGMPLPVALFDQNGSTDVGAFLVGAGGVISANQHSTSNITGVTINPDEGKTSFQKFQNAANTASEAMSLLGGLKSGGLGGALQAGSTAFQMTGNPYIAGAAAIAGFIGIGQHETPQQQPDINDAFYKQMLPNWAGTQQNLNGQMIQPNAQYSKYLGAQNEAQQMYNFVSNPASQIGMNPSQIASIKQMQALSGGMGSSGLAIKSEHQGVLTFASGQTMAVTDFDALLQNTGGLLDSFNNNVLQQQQNADRLASSFTSFVLNGPANFKMPDFVGGGSGAAGSVHRMPSPMTARTNGPVSPAATPAPVTVHILQGATINEASVAAVQQAIHNELPNITQAINTQNYISARLSGNYTSSNW